MSTETEERKGKQRKRKVTSEWSAEQVTSLIHNVECRPPLWDTSHTDYKNRNMRAKLIEEIATGMKKNSEEVTVKWQNLRSQYSAEQRKLKTKSGQGAAANTVKWKHFNALNFLSSQVDEGKFPPATSDSDEAEETRKVIKRPRKMNIKDELIRKDDLIKKAADVIAKPTDGPQIFGDYVAQKLRDFPPEVALRAQFEIEKQLLYSTQELLQVETLDIM